jgi:hypothetical protein
MARRIVITMLALVSALLIIAVIPLGLVAAGRSGIRSHATLMSAHVLAGVARRSSRAKLDNARDPALTRAPGGHAPRR